MGSALSGPHYSVSAPDDIYPVRSVTLVYNMLAAIPDRTVRRIRSTGTDRGSTRFNSTNCVAVNNFYTGRRLRMST